MWVTWQRGRMWGWVKTQSHRALRLEHFAQYLLQFRSQLSSAFMGVDSVI